MLHKNVKTHFTTADKLEFRMKEYRINKILVSFTINFRMHQIEKRTMPLFRFGGFVRKILSLIIISDSITFVHYIFLIIIVES